MFCSRSLAAFAALTAFAPSSARADVLPFASTLGYAYASDGTMVTAEDSHYETGNGPLAVDRTQPFGGGSGFAARADRVGTQVTLGAKASAAGGSAEHATYAGGEATYTANVNITPPSEPGPEPTTANFQVAFHGTLTGGSSAWFSLFNNGSGVWGSGQLDDLWMAGDVAHNLTYTADANGGYMVDGVVDFSVPLTMNEQGGLTGALQLSLSAGATTADGKSAVADFMDTAKLVAIVFPELGGLSAEELGFAIDFTGVPVDVVAFEDRPPLGPAAGGQVPEPASLLVWGAVAVLYLRRQQQTR